MHPKALKSSSSVGRPRPGSSPLASFPNARPFGRLPSCCLASPYANRSRLCWITLVSTHWPPVMGVILREHSSTLLFEIICSKFRNSNHRNLNYLVDDFENFPSEYSKFLFRNIYKMFSNFSADYNALQLEEVAMLSGEHHPKTHTTRSALASHPLTRKKVRLSLSSALLLQ